MPLMTLPLVVWIVCGAIKFGVNAARYGGEAIRRLGHGGFPSNHTAIVSSLMWAFALVGEWHLAALALAVLMVLIFDATGLRREVGRHAVALNQVAGAQMREIMGHTSIDIAGGLLLGLLLAVAYWFLGIVS